MDAPLATAYHRANHKFLLHSLVNTNVLVKNVLVTVCRPTEGRRVLMNLKGLAQHTILQVRGRPDDWKHWCEAFGNEIFTLPHQRMLESSALAYQAAIEGQGIALAQRVLVEKEINEGVLIEMKDHQLDCGDYTYYLVRPIESAKARTLQKLEQWLKIQ
jgi:LysR family glycine cleavage system transcriptional activator